ncbi:EF-hand domain-containing protein [Oleisolibacter albus]|uniref:EF-hand domain-containing protein n=1 Tax=Oleisolibacter albus TaxID=2171757 RepID=UPI00138FDB98|nr:hypothetical protein [Oleisolibacter albus]
MRLPALLSLSICLGLLSACSSRPGPVPLRYQAVSPSGELLAPPTADPDRFRQALVDWFHRSDSNGDGFLDKAEFLADADRSFAAFDRDGDGLITSLELTQMRMESPNRAPPPKPSSRLRPDHLVVGPEQMEAAATESARRGVQPRVAVDPVMSADTNADFRVSLAEMRAQAERRFAQFDANRDGRLSLDEVVERQMRLLKGLRGE